MDELISLEQPLQTSGLTLCHSSGVKIGSADLDLENVPTVRALLGLFFELIRAKASLPTFRLICSALREYLSGNNPSLSWSPHLIIADVCLTCLNFWCVRELPPLLPQPLSHTRLQDMRLATRESALEGRKQRVRFRLRLAFWLDSKSIYPLGCSGCTTVKITIGES